MKTVAALSRDPENIGAYVKWAKALALAKGDPEHARVFAERIGAPSRVLNILASKAHAGSTSDEGLAGLADTRTISTTFVGTLRNRSAFYALLDAGSLVRIPFRTRLSTTTADATAFVIGEGAAVPVSNMEIKGGQLESEKVNGLIAMTQEMMRSAGTAGEAFIARELRRVVSRIVDERFLGLVIDGDTPTINSTGDDADDAILDLRALLEAVSPTAESRLMWVFAPDAMRRAAALYSLGGQKTFPDLGISGGTIWDVPAMASDALPAGTVTLIDGTGIAGDSEAITLEASADTTITFEAEPTMNSVAPTALTNVSMFQTNSVAILATAWFGATRIVDRDNAIARLQNVNWGGEVPAS